MAWRGGGGGGAWGLTQQETRNMYNKYINTYIQLISITLIYRECFFCYWYSIHVCVYTLNYSCLMIRVHGKLLVIICKCNIDDMWKIHTRNFLQTVSIYFLIAFHLVRREVCDGCGVAVGAFSCDAHGGGGVVPIIISKCRLHIYEPKV